MSFWPLDSAGKIADVIAVVAFVGSGVTAFYARRKGNVTENAVKGLRHEFERRGLLPSETEEYQAAFKDLLAVLNSPPDRYAVSNAVGKFKGRLNALETLLRPSEMITVKSLKARIALVEAEPNAPNHLQILVSDAGTLSAELDMIVGKIQWNNPS